MANTYSMLGIPGKLTAPGVWLFKGDGWEGNLTQWGCDLANDKSTYSASFNLGNKHMFEALSEDPQEALYCIEHQVLEAADAFLNISSKSLGLQDYRNSAR